MVVNQNITEFFKVMLIPRSRHHSHELDLSYIKGKFSTYVFYEQGLTHTDAWMCTVHISAPGG